MVFRWACGVGDHVAWRGCVSEERRGGRSGVGVGLGGRGGEGAGVSEGLCSCRAGDSVRCGSHGVASCSGEAAGVAGAAWEQGLRGLFPAESAMGVGIVRDFHVFGVLREAPGPRCAHQLCAICVYGLVVRDPAEEDASRGQLCAE